MQIIAVHGTGVHNPVLKILVGSGRWWAPDSRFCVGLQDRLVGEGAGRCEFVEFAWSGRNGHKARLEAASELAEHVARIRGSSTEEPIVLVGHSHGANVVLAATNLLPRGAVRDIVLLANPNMSHSSGPVPCDASEPGDRASGSLSHGLSGCGGSTRRWLYWGDAVRRIDGRIWNLYSPDDWVQTYVARWLPGLGRQRTIAGSRRFRVSREYEGPAAEKVLNGVVRWCRTAPLFSGEYGFGVVGISAHGAMHSERMGRVVGRIIAEKDLSFEDACVREGIEDGIAPILDFGSRGPETRMSL